ncbi:beta strand repeat-containing protein [Derxia gummosa]|uniref:Beta strand repeat-containing protein n=1 Tax=Derxia gummosa DSM 723 TaxID=1121388 RepID=A0A8B6X609_9BURK|nr:hypothetical protein [Derxia gummosa]
MAIFTGNASSNTLIGGAGDDSISGLGGYDSLSGAAGNDFISGGDGNDTLEGGEGNDTLAGDAGNDSLTGGTGADSFVLGEGYDTIGDFDINADRIDVSGYGISDYATLQRLLGYDNAGNVTLSFWAAGSQRSTTFTGLWTTDFDPARVTLNTATTADALTGTNYGEVLISGLGNDTVVGGDGNDFIFGEGGNDLLYGGSGTPTGEIYGGNDTLVGGAGNDKLWGGGNDDVLEGGDGADTLEGGRGDDSLLGGTGADVFVLNAEGASENDRIGDFSSVEGDKLDLRNLGISDADTLQRLISNSESATSFSYRTGSGYTHTITFDGVAIAGIAPANLILSTTVSNDNVLGSSYADDLFGGLGNDTMAGTDGNDQLFGEGGNDVLYGGSASPLSEAYGGYDALFGGAGNDQLYGGGGNDTLDGGAGLDTLDGGIGDDTLGGGGGADVFVFRVSDNSSDTVLDFSQADGDRIDVSALGVGDFASLQRLMSTTYYNYGSTLVVAANGNTGYLTLNGVSFGQLTAADFIFSTDTVAGSLIGSSYGDALFGAGGNDTITGADGDDRLFGEAGNDVLYGGSGSPTGETYGGNDLLSGGAGNDQLFGGGYNDTLEGGAGNDTLDGGKHNDTLTGGSGADRFIVRNEGVTETNLVTDFSVADGDRLDVTALGISDFETVQRLFASSATGTTFTVRADGYTNTFQLRGLSASDLTAASFVFSTASTANAVTGGSGYDDLFGGRGNDTITGGDGYDRLFGESGNDVLYGGTASHVADRYDGYDFLSGGAGNDQLYGGGGYDTLDGGSGDDTLQGDDGYDTLIGGDGIDLASYAGEATGVRVNLLAGNVGRTGNNYAEDRLVGIEGAIGTDQADRFTGDAGDNLFFGGAGNDVLVGGAGNDVLNGGSGDDSLSGGAGLDVASYTLASGAISINLSTGIVSGADGEDALLSIEGVSGSGFADRITGSSAANLLMGNNGNDTISAGAGADTLVGGAGNDSLTGGSGADVFVFDSATGSDRVTDFSSGGDKLSFDASVWGLGDGDALLEGAVAIAGPGGFARGAELVIVTDGFSGSITSAASAAAAIGSATSAYAVGDDRLFVVNNGTQSAVWEFHADNANAAVEAGELSLVTLVVNTATTVVGDYQFV